MFSFLLKRVERLLKTVGKGNKKNRDAQSSRSAKKKNRPTRVTGTYEKLGKRLVDGVRSHMFHRK
jgi:hypothetical protein